MSSTEVARAQTGFYCSTSGTYFADKDALATHYRSDFHRYNLKRKVAGLPPVTKEWFEERKAQLSSTAAAGASTAVPVQQIWVDPLTKKRFNTENTYQVFVQSKKYAELVRKSGQPAPEPVIVTRSAAQQGDGAGASSSAAAPAKPARFKVVPPSGGLPGQQPDTTMADGEGKEEEEEDEDEDEEGSGWETASEDEVAEVAGQPGAGEGALRDAEGREWPEWDVCRSLLDNHVSPTFQANLEYMFKNFGFYLPDSEYLKDPEGLFKYLGAKVQVGRVPLYVRGDEVNMKQFRSLHAVQRHMVDTNQCKMVYDDNEDEYEEFYDYSMGQEDEAAGDGEAGALALAGSGVGGGLSGVAGYELVVGGSGEDGATGGKLLGHREFAQLYKQKHRPEDSRRSVVVGTMLARYRALGAPTNTDEFKTRNAKADITRDCHYKKNKILKMSMTTNILKKLPKNCTF